MSYRDHPTSTSYRTGTSANGSGGSSNVFDDSERSEDDSTSQLGIIVEENDREYSVYDVPLDTSQRGITDSIIMMNETTTGVGSLPHVEEFKATNHMMTKSSKGRNSRFRNQIASKLRGRRKLYISAAILLLVLIILLISIPITKRKNNNNRTSSSTSNNSNNEGGGGGGSFSFGNGGNGGGKRNATMDEVFQFLQEQDVYLDITPLQQTISSPQHQAALWLSRDDPANLKVPKTTDDNDTSIYRYLVRYVMAVTYFSFGGKDQWMNELGFLKPSNVCEWNTPILYGKRFEEAGVFCDTENYTSGIPDQLLLFSNNLKGTIPTEIGLLTSLTRLDLSSNTLLTGSIPTHLCQLILLQKLDLSWNTMTGNIPPCFGTTMTNLQWLYVPGNAMTGTISTYIGNMKQLQGFIIEDNMFTGNPIPVWNQLYSMRMLYASHNNFTGIINQTIFKGHKALEILDISHNQFTLDTTTVGSSNAFPHDLLTLFNLTHLDLSNNPLQGYFPKTLFPPNAINHILEYISLHDTQMNGTFPNLQQLRKIKHLDFSKNNFRGTIPSYFGYNNTNLELLYLSENPHFIPGTIPSTYVQLTKLRDLSLRNTRLQGYIPSYIGTYLSNLVLLDLGINNLTNTVPSTFGNLKKLEYLLLNGNVHLSGNLHPVTSANHPHLKILLVDGTQIKLPSINCKFTVSSTNNLTSELTVYTDCIRIEPPCECCKCCIRTQGFGCSNTLLASIDASWLQTFDRSSYTFFEDDEHDLL